MTAKILPQTWEEDGYTVTRTTAWSAPGCHEGCGVLCYAKDGKLVKVEGDRENPFNQGRLCPRCLTTPDITYHKDRIIYPLKRDPSKRGDPDAWERVSWDEAFDLWESEFKKIIEKYGAESIQGFVGTGRDILWESQRLCYAIGTPNVTSYATGLACWMPRCVAYIMTVGLYMMPDCSQFFEDRFDHPDYRIPEVIIVWGNNCVSSSSDGMHGDWVVECARRGSKLIVIDPRLTWMAARADIWLQPRPAVDTAVAIAMLKTIIDEDLYDHDFVDKWCFGFDEMVEGLAKYDVDKLAEIAWVPAEKLKAAARLYASGNNSAVQYGLALDMQRHGVSAVRAGINMMAVCGNIDVPGGQFFAPDPGDVVFFGWGWNDMPEEQREKLVGYHEYPIIQMGMTLAQPDLCLIQAETEQPYGFHGGFIMGSNPVNCMSMEDTRRVMDVMNKHDFLVCMDYVMTPTAQSLCDLFLPIAMYHERDCLRSQYVDLQALKHVPGVERPGEVKSDQEIILEMGKRFNEKMFPWNDVAGMYNALMEKTPISFEELKERTWWYPPDNAYLKYETGKLRPDGQPGFPTPSGRVELFSNIGNMMGINPLPYYDEPYESPLSTPEIYNEYPIITMTGVRNIQFFHSEHRQVAKLREICKDPTFEINDTYAASIGVEEGDWCWIENSRGRIRQRAHLTCTLKPETASLSSGWWYPEMDPHEDPAYGALDFNPNILIEPGYQGETGFGGDCKALLCKIYKVAEGEM
jgi:anaerobic selenocysteine-containing dehydrogenase